MAAQARSLEMCKGTARGCAGALCGAAQGQRHGIGLSRGVVCGCTRAQHGAAQKCGSDLRWGTVWSYLGVRCRPLQGRSKGRNRGAA